MNIEDIKGLNLSDEDFKMIIDGLEALPHKDRAGNLMFDLISSAMRRDSDAPETPTEKKIRLEREKNEKERENQIENVRILQGKLLMLKRYLMENGALKQAKDILNRG